MASINRGDNTAAFGSDFLRIYLNNPNNLYIQRAVFQINGQLEKEFFDPKFPLRINFTGEETEILHEVNRCKLALWDEHGRRRTAEGKFTFFVKENHIKQPDTPDYFEEEYNEDDSNNIIFAIDDAEFAAQFSINATPSKVSQLEMDIPIMTFDKIKDGDNIRTYIDEDNNLVINADLDATIDWSEIENKPTINGQELEGDVQIEIEQVNPDWKATEGPAQILNKPNLHNVAYSGYYKDLTGKPDIPEKLSDLVNDKNFITKSVNNLENYMTRDEVQSKIDNGEFLEPINERIDNLLEKHDEDVAQLQDNIDLKASKDELNDVKLELQQELDDGLAQKLNSSKLGKGNLYINENGHRIGQFNANSTYDTTVEIDMPTKLSQLQNDKNFITQDEINLDELVKKTDYNADKENFIEKDDIGTGILTIKENGNTLGTFNANSKLNKTVNIQVPVNVSDLNLDIDILTEEDLDDILADINALQTDVNAIPAELTDLQSQIDNKVNIVPGKTLISQAEIDRLSAIREYNDTEVRNLITQNIEDIDKLKLDIQDKIDYDPTKGLSTNDFTDHDKENVDRAIELATTVDTNISRLTTKVNKNITDIEINKNAIQDLSDVISNETAQRENQDNYLQSQIEALTTKSTVVDILATEDDLNTYPTSKLKNGDVLCVLKDLGKNDTTTYYRWDGSTFFFVGSEGEYYTKSDSNSIFVRKTFLLNGHDLTTNLDLNAADVHALPDNTFLSNKTITIQKNGTLVDTFTLNSEENKAINIPIPTKVDDLEDKEGWVNKEYLHFYIGDVPDDDNLQDQVNGIKESEDANAREIQSLKDLITGEIGGLPPVALSGSYLDLRDKPTIPTKTSQLENDNQFITAEEVENGYVKPEQLPTKVSQFENDRGYVTNTAIGRGNLTFKINNNDITIHDDKTGLDEETWMANEKEDKLINIPVSNSLSSTSTLPIACNTATNEMSRIDTSAVHKAGDETITDTKTFANIVATNETVTNITITNGTSTTKGTTDNSTNIATTAYVKNQDYCTNTDAVHKAQEETITGKKTFTGDVVLNNAVGKTMAQADNSTNLATTAYVKSQDYATNTQAVHKSGNETIQGDKTFNDTVEMNGIVRLSKYSHVPTPDLTDTTNNDPDLVVNVQFVQDVETALNTRITNEVSTLNTTITNKENALSTRINNNQTDISNLSTNLSTNYSTTTQMNAAIKVVADALDAFETQVATNNVTVADFNSFKTTLETRLQAIEDRLDALEAGPSVGQLEPPIDPGS